MNKTNTGNLGYIPSEVLIVKINESGNVTRCEKTSKPKNVLILEPVIWGGGKSYHEILYDGEKWFVSESDISIIPHI
jgi:hypothetical protein